MDLTDFVFRNVGTGRGSYNITARGLRFVFAKAGKRTSFCPSVVNRFIGYKFGPEIPSPFCPPLT